MIDPENPILNPEENEDTHCPKCGGPLDDDGDCLRLMTGESRMVEEGFPGHVADEWVGRPESD